MLPAKQALFIEHYLVDFNGTQAAISAGYSPRTARVQASDLLTKPNIKLEISRKQDETARRLEITRDGVIRGIVAAIEQAKAQGDPGTMIKGCAELNKMMGFYRPEGEGADETVSDDDMIGDRLRTMSDEVDRVRITLREFCVSCYAG